MGKIEIQRGFVEGVVRQTLLRCVPDTTAAEGEISPLARELFDSPEALRLKEEIVRTGRKLWAREYVDGNGGNISCRLSSDYVLSTPTMCSKGDLTVEDLCLVDLQNRKVIGKLEPSSEILLHLEIYKTVPRAGAVIHCHPPHATAYAITGQVPPAGIIPEAEVFAGPMVMAPYETSGTQAFAETILPYVQYHNTILLANHGIVCWADTVTHAEWSVEVADTYCRTLMLASSLEAPTQKIPPEKLADLLEIKQKLGLPDPRLPAPEEAGTPHAESTAEPTKTRSSAAASTSSQDFEALVASVTQQVLRFIKENK